MSRGFSFPIAIADGARSTVHRKVAFHEEQAKVQFYSRLQIIWIHPRKKKEDSTAELEKKE